MTYPLPDLRTLLAELDEFLDGYIDVDDGVPNRAMNLLVQVRAARGAMDTAYRAGWQALLTEARALGWGPTGSDTWRGLVERLGELEPGA